MNEWEPVGFIRQEGNQYYLRNLAGEEGLAYDFGVSVGDSLGIENPFGAVPVSVIVTGIDSVWVEPAHEKRKRITISDYPYYIHQEQWIEGIGSLAGLTVSGMDITLLTGGDDYTLLCYYEEGEMLFQTELYSLCFYPIVGIPESNFCGSGISINPNPVFGNSYLRINYTEIGSCTVIIHNSCGNIIRKIVLSIPGSMNINRTDFKAGIYFYTVTSENFFYTDKFIVQ